MEPMHINIHEIPTRLAIDDIKFEPLRLFKKKYRCKFMYFSRTETIIL